MARIQAALLRWGPAIVEAGGNQYDRHDPKHPQYGQEGGYSRSWPLTDPLRTLDTTPTKALLVPVEGRAGKRAASDLAPLRTQTTRNDLGLLVMLRGQNAAKSVGEPLDTVAAAGNHHALLVPSGGTWHDQAYPDSDPMRTVTTRENHGLLVPYYGRTGSGLTTSHPSAPSPPTIATRWSVAGSTRWTACSGCSNPTRSGAAWPSSPTTWCSAPSASG